MSNFNEPIIDPALPIVDPHHHLWFIPEAKLLEGMSSDDPHLPFAKRMARYLFDDFMKDLDTGHNVRATVFVDSHAMYRVSGPEAMKSLGEVEFANGAAAMAASGIFGDIQVCAGIVGNVNLQLGESAEEVLHAHMAASPRYRGVRASLNPHDKQYCAGFEKLQPLGLSFEATAATPRLPMVIDLAHAFPETQIILSNCLLPRGIGTYAIQRTELLSSWRETMRALSACANIAAKVGGVLLAGTSQFYVDPPGDSAQFAEELRPYVETIIELFGTDRCMFESNYPSIISGSSYPGLWNAFKRLTSRYSNEEKTALFSGTATKVYRLDI